MTTDLRVQIVTWNVGEADPPEDFTDLLNLDRKRLPAVYAIGLQELKAGIKDLAVDAFYDDVWTNRITKVLSHRDYVRVRSVRLVGMHIALFVQRKFLPHVRNVETSYTKTGFGGLWGNKGAVTVRLELFGVNVCFVNCHFQAHMHNYEGRLNDYDDVVESQRFDDKETPGILDHDYVFWFGDLNFRINEVPRDEVIKRVQMKEYDYLLQYDQLKHAMKEELILIDFEEGPVQFDPTYKYDFGTDTYDTSSKQRKPSWCDRILWKVEQDNFENLKLGVQQLTYTDLGSYRDSDHKPLVSEFIMKVLRDPPPLPVTFLPVDEWRARKDGVCRYIVDPDKHKISLWDWVGLYKANYRHDRDYVSYTYAVQSGKHLTDGGHLMRMVFEDHKVRVSPGLYCLCYYGYKADCIIGYSDTFMITSKSGKMDSDLSETSSASSDSSS